MAKLTLNDIASGWGSSTKHNANNDLIETALENTLSRDGTTPNEMEADLDMNSNEILNLGSPTTNNSAARWIDVATQDNLDTTVPSQSGNDGKFLKTTGSALVWDTVAGTSGTFAITAKETAAGLTEGDLALEYPPGHILRYQPAGDGVTDDYDAVQYAMSSNYNGAVYFEPGLTYLIGTNILITENTTVFAHGAKFTINHTGTAFTLNNDVEWCGGEFTGPGSAYSANSKCFAVTGTRNGAGVAPTRVSNIRICDVSIDQFGNAGIEISYAQDVDIINPRLTNLGYVGVMGYCTNRMRVINPYINTLVGDSNENCYGVTFTTNNGGGYDSVRDPVSADCEVRGGYIINIPTWHALDAHAGSYCRFEGVTAYNCRRGFILTNNGTVGSSNCTINNCVYINELSGTTGLGEEKNSEAIWDIGVSDSARNTENAITNNRIVNAGKVGGVGGAIFIEYSSDCVVRGNSIEQAKNEAFYIGTRVRRLSIDSNTIVDVHGPGTPDGPSNVIHGVLFNEDYFENCSVTNNLFAVKNTDLDTYMLNSGITLGNYANKSVHIDNNVFKGVTDEVTFVGATYSSQTWGNNVTGGWSGYHPSTDTILLSLAFSVEEKISLAYSKYGNMVVLRFGGFSGKAGNKTTYNFSWLPSFLHPQNDVYGSCRIKTASSGTGDPLDNWRMAAFVIAGTSTETGQSSGTLIIHKDTAGSAWGSSDYRGHESFTVAYTVLTT